MCKFRSLLLHEHDGVILHFITAVVKQTSVGYSAVVHVHVQYMYMCTCTSAIVFDRVQNNSQTRAPVS